MQITADGPLFLFNEMNGSADCVGNGTEACVAACAPHTARFSFKTAFSEGAQTFAVYRPWLGSQDSENVLFARWRLLTSILLRHTRSSEHESSATIHVGSDPGGRALAAALDILCMLGEHLHRLCAYGWREGLHFQDKILLCSKRYTHAFGDIW